MAFLAKRQFPRTTFREGVKIRSSRGVEYSTFEDLSAGGLRLYLDHDVEIGSIFELSFSLRVPGAKVEELVVMGRAVRSVKSGSAFFVGIEFIDLTSKHRESLQAMVDSGDGPF